MYGPAFESDRAIAWDELVHEVGAACAAYLLDEHDGAPRARAKRRYSLTPRQPRLLDGSGDACYKLRIRTLILTLSTR